jgi:hypothetical protein
MNASPTGLDYFSTNKKEIYVISSVFQEIIMIITIIVLVSIKPVKLSDMGNKEKVIIFLILLSVFNLITFALFWFKAVDLSTETWIKTLVIYILYYLTTLPGFIAIIAIYLVYTIISTVVLTIVKEFFNIMGKSTDDFVRIYQNPNMKESAIAFYGVLYATIAISLCILCVAMYDQNALSGSSYAYGFAVLLPILFGFFYVVPVFSGPQTGFYQFFIVGLALALFGAIFYFYSSMTTSTFVNVSYFANFIIIAMLIGGLAAFFDLFSNYLKSLNGWLGFIVYFIFYIPCLLLDFIKYVYREYKLTGSPVFVIFILEIIFIILYLYVPQLVTIATNSNAIVLLKDSMYLDSKQTIGNATQFKLSDSPGTITNSTVYRENYTISMWVFLNIEGMNEGAYNKETEIFNYGKKARITYFNHVSRAINKITQKEENDNSKANKFNIYFTDKASPYATSMNLQKWNNIVFNYSSQKVDLFINGELEYTFTFNDNQPTYSGTDYVTIGEKNGLNGAISNVRYLTTPLTAGEIANNYNLLMYKSPPTL